MGKPKKPRHKRHIPRQANIPMMRETRDSLALRMRMAFETLIASPSVESYNEASLQLVTLGRVVGPQEFMERAKQAMLDVFSRFERIERMDVSASEAAILRDTSRHMDHVIALIPVNKFAAAEAKTRDWCAANNVQA